MAGETILVVDNDHNLLRLMQIRKDTHQGNPEDARKPTVMVGLRRRGD